MRKHEWILSVFDDIKYYSEANGLQEIVRMLREAKQAAALELGIEKNP